MQVLSRKLGGSTLFILRSLLPDDMLRVHVCLSGSAKIINMRLLSQRMGEILLTDLSIPLFEPYLISSAARRIGAGLTGDYLFQEFPFAGGFIRLTHLMEKEENKIIIVEESPVIIFQLGLRHSLTYRLDDIGQLLFHEWAYNFYHTLSLLKEVHFNDRDNYIVLEIQVSLDYMNSISLQYDFVKDFLFRIKEGKPAKLARVSQIASSRMMDKVQVILEGDPTRIDDQAKELLLLALDNQLLNPVYKQSKLTGKEVDRIYEIKDFLFGNLHTMFTQEALSDRMNLPEYQIRKGFKEIYRMTYLELSNIERMHRGTLLIKKGNKKMWEIAVILGYSSKNSFLKAYKKYYGETPSGMVSKN